MLGHSSRKETNPLRTRPTVIASTRIFSYLALLILGTGIVGCGGAAGESASITGKITFNGQPIAKGAIRLSTEDGTPGDGGLSPISNGQYEIPAMSGLKAGKYLVIILAFKETGRMIRPEPEMPERKEEVQYIPAQYNNSSQLHLEIVPGENSKDFDLTK